MANLCLYSAFSTTSLFWAKIVLYLPGCRTFIEKLSGQERHPHLGSCHRLNLRIGSTTTVPTIKLLREAKRHKLK